MKRRYEKGRQIDWFHKSPPRYACVGVLTVIGGDGGSLRADYFFATLITAFICMSRLTFDKQSNKHHHGNQNDHSNANRQ